MRVNFTVVLLLVFSLVTLAQDYSTWGEIYDYEVGDEFHYKELHYTHDYWLFRDINKIIVGRDESSGGDTITYTRFVKQYTIITSGPEGYEEFYENRVVYNANSLCFADSVYYTDDYNGRKISLLDYTIGQDVNSDEYVDGCGLAVYRRNYWDPAPNNHSIRLLYFKKGEEEWGTPNPVVGIPILKQQRNDIQIYPNPARDNLQISSSENIEGLMICDQYGRL
ncbi:MAG: hypothetical protein V2I47_00005, partial [Bacteroidales bacterium]|nr:hypothetical protein [Bacteroidales bacterium]